MKTRIYAAPAVKGLTCKGLNGRRGVRDKMMTKLKSTDPPPVGVVTGAVQLQSFYVVFNVLLAG